MTLDPLDLLSGLVLESDDRWGSVATDWQLADAAAIFDRSGPRWHYLTRPRGGSKSTDAAGVALCWLATEAPAGARGYVVAVDSDQAALDVDAASGLVDRTPGLGVDVQALKAVGRSGASVEVLSADGASAYGLRPHLMIVEELGAWPSNARLQTAVDGDRERDGEGAGHRLVVVDERGRAGPFLAQGLGAGAQVGSLAGVEIPVRCRGSIRPSSQAQRPPSARQRVCAPHLINGCSLRIGS